MDRALKTIRTEADRTLILTWVMQVPVGTRVRLEHSQRSLPQNALMWAMLTDVAQQARHMGRRYSTEVWKALFMHACGRERKMQFLQSLDGSTFIPWGEHSSDLSKSEMSELIDFIGAWGTEHGVIFHDHREEVQHEKPSRSRRLSHHQP